MEAAVPVSLGVKEGHRFFQMKSRGFKITSEPSGDAGDAMADASFSRFWPDGDLAEIAVGDIAHGRIIAARICSGPKPVHRRKPFESSLGAASDFLGPRKGGGGFRGAVPARGEH